MGKIRQFFLTIVVICFGTLGARGQSLCVQCPPSTITHPVAGSNNSEPAYNGPTQFTPGAQGYLTASANPNGAIKCQQVSGGDGYATMADGTQTFHVFLWAAAGARRHCARSGTTTTHSGTVTLTNNATFSNPGPLTLSAGPGITVTTPGPSGSGLTITGGTCSAGLTVAPGGTCTIIVTDNPNGSAATQARAHLTVNDTGAATPSQGVGFDAN